MTSNDEIMTLVSDIEQGNNAWAVGRFDVLTSHANLPNRLPGRFPGEVVRRGRPHQRRRVGHGRVEANDDEAAELLRRQMNGALAFGEMVGRRIRARRPR